METSMDQSNRNILFEELRSNKPLPGCILEAKNKGVVRVFTDDTKTSKTGDCKQIMFVNVEIDYECSGWYLTSKSIGLKALILSRSQDVLISKFNNLNSIVVDKIRVIRHNLAKTALICEIVE